MAECVRPRASGECKGGWATIHTEKNTIFTNDIEYKVQVMNYIGQLYNQKKLYKTLNHTPYCYYCSSSLANAEIEKKEIQEKIYLLSAELIDGDYAGFKLLFATSELETVYQNQPIRICSSYQR